MICPCGEMVYTRDLKSLGFGHTSSSLVRGTTFKEIIMLKFFIVIGIIALLLFLILLSAKKDFEDMHH